MNDTTNLTCSFCGDSKPARLIAGVRGVAICGECIYECVLLLREKREKGIEGPMFMEDRKETFPELRQHGEDVRDSCTGTCDLQWFSFQHKIVLHIDDEECCLFHSVPR